MFMFEKPKKSFFWWMAKKVCGRKVFALFIQACRWAGPHLGTMLSWSGLWDSKIMSHWFPSAISTARMPPREGRFPDQMMGGETGVRGGAPRKKFKKCIFKPFWMLWLCGIDRSQRDLSARKFSARLLHSLVKLMHLKNNANLASGSEA